MNAHRESDVVLLYPGQSLLLQAARWVRSADWPPPRLVASWDARQSAAELRDAAVAIIDATETPGEAMAALERCLPSLQPGRVAVYCEQVHAGLELFVRVRGVPLLLGPMSPREWSAFLEPMERAASADRTAREAWRVPARRAG